MGIFGKKQQSEIIINKDYETLMNRITDIGSQIKILETAIETLRININSLNGRFNRYNSPKETESENIKGNFPFNIGGGA